MGIWTEIVWIGGTSTLTTASPQPPIISLLTYKSSVKRGHVNNADGSDDSVHDAGQVFNGRLPASNFGVARKRRRKKPLIGQRLKSWSVTVEYYDMFPSVWPNLAKFHHFGEKLKVFGNFLRVYLYKAKFWVNFGQKSKLLCMFSLF